MKRIFFLIIILGTALLFGSYKWYTTQKIEYYITKHCDFKKNDTCYVYLRDALKMDYDTMYAFNLITPLMGVRNIIGRDNYGKCKSPEGTLLGYDSETYRIILVKNNEIISERDIRRKRFICDGCTIVYGQGIFDGKPSKAMGYVCTNHIFKIYK